MKKSLEMLDQIITKARYDDIKYKKDVIAKHEASKSVGESWMIFHLTKLKELIQEEYDAKK